MAYFGVLIGAQWARFQPAMLRWRVESARARPPSLVCSANSAMLSRSAAPGMPSLDAARQLRANTSPRAVHPSTSRHVASRRSTSNLSTKGCALLVATTDNTCRPPAVIMLSVHFSNTYPSAVHEAAYTLRHGYDVQALLTVGQK